MLQALAAHIDSHQTAKLDWPSNAEFMVLYNMSTWPTGWNREASAIWFQTREQLDAWILAQHKWARLEDNHIAYQGYRWDLGPNRMDDVCWMEGNVGFTYEQYQGV